MEGTRRSLSAEAETSNKNKDEATLRQRRLDSVNFSNVVRDLIESSVSRRRSGSDVLMAQMFLSYGFIFNVFFFFFPIEQLISQYHTTPHQTASISGSKSIARSLDKNEIKLMKRQCP